MGIARSTASKAIALPSKVLCVLVILSLVGQTFPALAREPISVASSTPATQPGNLLTELPSAPRRVAEQVLAPLPAQLLTPVAAANEDCFTPVVNEQHHLFLPLLMRNASGVTTVAATSTAPTIPVDPSINAPPLDRSVATDIFQATAFLYGGANPIQTDVVTGTIVAKCVSVLRGQVLTSDGQPLPGVAVSIHNHSEYGQTLSRADGLYDLVINGGKVIVSYTKTGYLPVQRTVQARWREYMPIEPVVMTPLDPHVTTIVMTSTSAIQVAHGSAISDTDGQRQATLLFPANTQAVITLTNGTTQTLSTLNVRATEYTVGERGIQAMPGNLPAMSGYTYAVEFSVDEADAAGAKDVRFDQAVINYTENFIHAPIGSPVPTGYYDRAQGKWIPAKNGRVIKILSETAGKADVDVTGDGVADTGAALTALGITDAERGQLANLYNAGQELWRVPITHFTPWDHNWPYGPPPGAKPPQLKWFNNEEPDPCWTSGSNISCETQTLGESVPVVGSPFKLVYQSDRVPGWKVGQTMDVPVTGAPLPPLLKGVRLQIEIGGRTFEQRWEDPTSPISSTSTTPYPPIVPNLKYHFEWDGLDAYGRLMQGRPLATIRVMYIYDFIYYEASDAFDSSFAQFGDNVQLFDGRFSCRDLETRFFCGIPIEQTVYRSLGPWDVTPIDGLGSWTLNVHHSYDPSEQVVHKGDGSLIRATALGALYTSIAGGGSKVFPAAEGGSALDANIDYLGDVAVGPDGSVYFFQGMNSSNNIRKIDPNGIVTTYAGNGLRGLPTGDGGPALQATLGPGINAIAAGPDGSLYLAVPVNDIGFQKGYIRKIDPNGIITTIAGNGRLDAGKLGDGGPAINAELSDPIDVIVGPDGSVYFSERGSSFNFNKGRVRRIDLNGIVNTIAGGGTDVTRDEDLGNGEPATKHDIKLPYHLAFGPDGSLYIPDPNEHVVKRVTPDGIIRRFAGTRSALYGGDGGPALQANLGDALNVAVGPDGIVYIRTRKSYDHIRTVTPDGIITAFAGKDNNCGGALSPDGIAPLQACIFTNSTGLEIYPDGSLIVGDGRHRIRRIGLPLAGFSVSSLVIPSPDNLELYEFDPAGRHLRTRDALTGVTRYQFTYDTAGRFSDVTDANGLVTHIERTAGGTPTAIVAPNGQRTTVTLNTDGYLHTIANPAGNTTSLTYWPGGLLATLTDPRDGVHTFSYDGPGRLLSDQGPSGEIKTLTRSAVEGLTTVTVTTGLNRSTIYATEVLSTGDRLRTVTAPDGSKTTLRIGQDGTRVLDEPDGTRTTSTLGPDPRWGMRTPIAASEIITLPGGLHRQTLRSRTVTLTDDKDPLSVEQLTDYVTINGRQFRTTYDALAHTITRQSPEYRSSVTTLDAQSRVTSFVADYGLTPITFTYNSDGNIARVQQGVLAITSTYDALKRVAARTDATGAVTHYSYDAANRIITLTLPSGYVYNFTYDASGNRTSVIMPGGATHVLSYTASNDDAGYNPPGLGELTKSYDLDGALSERLLPDGRAVGMIYNTDGRLDTETYDEASVAFAYGTSSNLLDALVRNPIGAGSPQTTTLLYAGSLLTRTDSIGAATGQYTYTYDNNLFLTNISLLSGSDAITTPLTRDKEGQVTGYGPFTIVRDGPGGAQSAIGDGTLNLTLAYDALAQRTQRNLMVNGVPLYKSQLSYDKAGNIMQNIETVSGISHTLTYQHDADGQLHQVRRDGALIETYGYDSHANRTSVQLGANPIVIATYDSQDRIANQGSVNYQFNAAGQLTQRGTDTFMYSARSELLQAAVNGQTITYSYDALRRRVARTDGSGTYQYLYGNPGNPFWITAMRDPAGQLTSYYYDDEGLLFAFQRGADRYYVASDQVGTPRVVVNSSGTIVKRMDYDSFGNLTNDSAPGFDLPIGFAGGLADQATKLVHFGYRDYDPAAGRWTARDPARYDGGQFNLYVYVQNDPIQLRDPAGLGYGIGGSLYEGIGLEGEIMISSEGVSACFGVGVGVGSGLGIKSGDIVKRSGVYVAGELTGKIGPAQVTTGFEIDPCGNMTQTPGKFTLGPYSLDVEGNEEFSVDPESYTDDALNSTEVKLEGKLTAKYCATTLD